MPKYTNSSLVNHTHISPMQNPRVNSYYNETGKIDKITIHHMAGNLSVETCGNVFQSREASSNYGIGSDGRVGLYVEESGRSWASGSPENDYRAVTIEVANCQNSDPWPVSKAAYEKLILLCADICKRNGIKKLNYTGDTSGNLTMHCWFQATGCPGPYLKARFKDIANRVNALLGQSDPTPAPTPSHSGKIKVGDVVNFLGGNHYYSTDASSPASTGLRAGKAKVTVIANGKHPYHLIHTDGSTSVYGWVDASQIKEAQSSKPATKEYKVGDVVKFKGGNHYSSANATSPASTGLPAGPAKVTVKASGAHPYHLVHTNSATSVYGWVNASQIEGAATPSKPSKPETFKKGDRVKLKSSTTRWVTGETIPSWVKNSQLYICNWSDNNPCVTINSNLSGITGVVKQSDIYHN